MKSTLLALFTLLPSLALAQAVAPAPAAERPAFPLAEEKDIFGPYINAQSGGLVEYLPGGKLVGFPVGGSYKFLETGKMELFGKDKEGKEERIPTRVYKTPDGIALLRNVHGVDEPTFLERLTPALLEPDKWQGPGVIHLLLAMDKTARKREISIDQEGYFRTKEKGYYFRLMKGSKEGSIVAYSTEQNTPTFSVNLMRTGPLFVAYDTMEKPKFLAIFQIDAKLDPSKKAPEPKPAK